MVKLVSERTPGALPSNIKVNPREHINVVSVVLRRRSPSRKRYRNHLVEVLKRMKV